MKIFLFVISTALLFAGILPLIKKDHWTFRVFEYPRFQKFWATLTLFLVWVFYYAKEGTYTSLIFTVLLGVMLIYLSIKIFPFLPMAPKMVKDAPKNCSPDLKIMVINVYQYNREYEQCTNLMKKEDPDVFLMVETDQGWAEKIRVFKPSHPYNIEIPLDNTYGMLFYSRFPISYREINYLVDPEIPSLVVDIKTEEDKTIRCYSLHPTPPVPGENTHSTERDAEILLVGKMAKAYNKPCIVMGDLNDVAWSFTNKLFLKTSQMSDPRRGRGMFSTFHAKYPLLRWPLDHIFLSDHFKLIRMVVHKSIESDHLPISAELCLDENNENQKFDQDEEDKKEAMQKINDGLN